MLLFVCKGIFAGFPNEVEIIKAVEGITEAYLIVTATSHNAETLKDLKKMLNQFIKNAMICFVDPTTSKSGLCYPKIHKIYHILRQIMEMGI